MDGSSVMLAYGAGGQKATSPFNYYAGDDVALLASTSECTKNGKQETKDGFYQYGVAWDFKHIVFIHRENPCSFYILCQEMKD